jgi:hypothetical protein
MTGKLSSSLTKKLIWLAFLTMATFFVTSRTNNGEITQPDQPAVSREAQTDSSAQPSVEESLSAFRSSYNFVEQPIRKKH